tara:strand:- start:867 stop:2609 length:1743 start_codon:yes stop_codon:yes gene_type:complete
MNIFQKGFFLLSKTKKRDLFYLSFLLFVGIIFEMLSLSILFPIFELLLEPDLANKYTFYNDLLLFFDNPSKNNVVIIVMLLLTFIFFVKNLFIGFLSWMQSSFAIRLSEEVSNKLFKGYLNQNYLFHVSRNSSKLISNIQIEIQQFSSFVQSLIFMTLEIAVLSAVLFTLLYIEPLGTAFVFSVISLFSLLFYFFTRKSLKIWGEKRQIYDANLNKHLLQGFGGIKDLILYGRESFFYSKYRKQLNLKSNIYIKQLTLLQVPRLYIEFLAIFCMSSLIIILIFLDRPIESFLPTVGVFMAAAFRALPSVNKIIGSLQNIKFTKPVINLLYNEILIFDKNDIKYSSKNITFNDKIQLKDLSFKYPNTKKSILKKISFNIKKGESIGIIGESGSGKSTLVDNILGLLKPESGEILVDKKSIFLNLPFWKKLIGYVPQTIYLTDDTLINNIAFGINSKDIDMKKINSSVENSNLLSFINSLPNGLNSMVGERGVKLSGGQRQRIGIARALYNNPEILVFDEATSALDSKNEREVMNSIMKLKGIKTTIIIAHRLTTLYNCDKIIELKDGLIKQITKPSDIIKV